MAKVDFFSVHFDKVYNFTHVEIGRLKMDGEYTFFPTTAFQVSSNLFESTSKHWTEFKTIHLEDEPSAITTIPLNLSAKNFQFMTAEGDSSIVELSKGVQLTIPDFPGISLENFKQEGESSIVMTIPDLEVNDNNRQTFITALQQSRGNDKFVT